MAKTEDFNISFKVNENPIKRALILSFMVLNELAMHFVKSLITIIVLYLFISMLIYNLQIQHFDNKGHIADTTTILQIDSIRENMRSYIQDESNIF